MMLSWILIGGLVLLAAVVLVFVAWKLRGGGLSEAAKKKLEQSLREAVSQQDPVRRVLAVDSVLDRTLTALGFTGSLGDKLKKAGPRIPTIQAVWEAHKLRNRFAHEHDAAPNAGEVDRAVRILEHAIRSLIR